MRILEMVVDVGRYVSLLALAYSKYCQLFMMRCPYDLLDGMLDFLLSMIVC